MNVLLLSGWYEYRERLESFEWNQRRLRDVFKISGWNVTDMGVVDESSVVRAYASLHGQPLLVIYTGHGEAAMGSPFPNICPVNRSFNLLSIPRFGPTSYILDCCNVNDGEEPLFQIANNHGLPRFSTRCLDPSQQYIICMRKQLCGYTKGSGTVVNLGMCGVVYHFDCHSILQFCQVLNGYCNAEYKAKGYVKNKRLKYVITLNGANPGLSIHTEGALCQIMSTMKWPPKFPGADIGLAPAAGGIELIMHLGGGGAAVGDIQPDSSDEVATQPEEVQLLIQDVAAAAVETAENESPDSTDGSAASTVDA